MEWSDIIPRMLHDSKALLRKPQYKMQLLERRLVNPDPETKELTDAIIAGQKDLDRFFTRVGLLADSMVPRTYSRLPLGAVILGVQLASKEQLSANAVQIEASRLANCQVSSRLQIAVQELVDNSLRFKATDRSLLISLTSEIEDDRLILKYLDNSEGWDRNFTHRLFMPFERLDAKRSGFALGLAIVKAIVTGCGGTITADTSANASQFVMELPLSDAIPVGAS